MFIISARAAPSFLLFQGMELAIRALAAAGCIRIMTAHLSGLVYDGALKEDTTGAKDKASRYNEPKTYRDLEAFVKAVRKEGA